MANCARCDADVGEAETCCSTCGLRTDRRGLAIANAAPLGVATLLGCAALELSLHMSAYLPAPEQGHIGSGASLYGSVIDIGNDVMVVIGGYALALVVGVAAGTYAVPKKWWAGALVGLLSALLAACLIQLGSLRQYVEPREMNWLVVGTATVGAALAGFVVERLPWHESRLWAKVSPRWLGAAKALVWAPLLIAFLVVGTYVATAAFLLFLTYLALRVVWAILRAFLAADSPEAQQARRARQAAWEEAHARQQAEEQGQRAQAQAAEEQARKKELATRRNVGVHYDVDGNKIGRTNEDGYTFDTRGNKVAWTSEDGHVHQAYGGGQLGRRDSEGTLYDNRGNEVSRSDEDGRHYSDGERVGRTDREG